MSRKREKKNRIFSFIKAHKKIVYYILLVIFVFAGFLINSETYEREGRLYDNLSLLWL